MKAVQFDDYGGVAILKLRAGGAEQPAEPDLSAACPG